MTQTMTGGCQCGRIRYEARIESDEATYNLHIAIRFEMELALLSGDALIVMAYQALASAGESRFRLTPDRPAAGRPHAVDPGHHQPVAAALDAAGHLAPRRGAGQRGPDRGRQRGASLPRRRAASRPGAAGLTGPGGGGSWCRCWRWCGCWCSCSPACGTPNSSHSSADQSPSATPSAAGSAAPRRSVTASDFMAASEAEAGRLVEAQRLLAREAVAAHHFVDEGLQRAAVVRPTSCPARCCSPHGWSTPSASA